MGKVERILPFAVVADRLQMKNNSWTDNLFAVTAGNVRWAGAEFRRIPAEEIQSPDSSVCPLHNSAVKFKHGFKSCHFTWNCQIAGIRISVWKQCCQLLLAALNKSKYGQACSRFRVKVVPKGRHSKRRRGYEIFIPQSTHSPNTSNQPTNLLRRRRSRPTGGDETTNTCDYYDGVPRTFLPTFEEAPRLDSWVWVTQFYIVYRKTLLGLWFHIHENDSSISRNLKKVEVQTLPRARFCWPVTDDCCCRVPVFWVL